MLRRPTAESHRVLRRALATGWKLRRDFVHRVLRVPWYAVQPRDRLLASWPRSGNTWLRNLLLAYMNGAVPGTMDELDASMPTLDHFEFRRQLLGLEDADYRFIKTHDFPFRGVEECRVVYLIRHPVPASVSYAHLIASRSGKSGVSDMLAWRVAKGFVRYGGWQRHVSVWSDFADKSPNVMVLRYEDLVASPDQALSQVLLHFGVNVSSDRLSGAVAAVSRAKVEAQFASWAGRRGWSFTGTARNLSEQSSIPSEWVRVIENACRDGMLRLGYGGWLESA